ncbi:aggrecan core protein isoform X2 [Trichomycterus rosablanca]|uniref:aggrecan core protein isoform X2 n=1 Tax=Trichomycterus rosablanca TaxID=2290929 RepID=UPI002F355C08
MGGVSGPGGLSALAVLLCIFAGCGLSKAQSLVTGRKVTHPPVHQHLAGSALLPCVHTLQLGSSHRARTQHIRWTHVQGETETTVLSLEGKGVRVRQAYAGRVSLPGYHKNSLNISLEISQLRANDSGTFRCHVTLGDTYEQDTVTLEVTGVVFHYRTASGPYSLSFEDAEQACKQNSARLASPEELLAAFHSGLNDCSPGWLSDQTVRYSIQNAELGCYGHSENSQGVRNYGKRDPSELFDVYCFASDMQGKVFPSGTGSLSLTEAVAHCTAMGAQLATIGQLYLAWRSGLELCEPGWLADGSVRFSVITPRPECGSGQPGVHTISITELSNGTSLFNAYCYRETQSSSPEESHPEVPSPQLSNWTGLIDLDQEPISDAKSSSDNYVTVSLFENDASLDWSNQADSLQDTWQEVSSQVSYVTSESPGGMAEEENEDDEDFLTQTVTAAPSTMPATTKTTGSFRNIMSSFWKPWNYLTGNKEEVKDTTPSPLTTVPVVTDITESAETTVSAAETTVLVGKTTVLVAETTVPVEKTTVLDAETIGTVGKTTVLVADTTVPAEKITVLVAETTVPVEKTTVLDVETTSSVEKSTISVAETTVPVQKTTVSSAGTTASVEKTTVFVAETTSPVKKSTASVAETTVPAAGTTAPIKKTTVLDAKTTAPGEKSTVLVAETTSPVEMETVSIAETTVPVQKTTVSVAGTTVPVEKTTVSVAGTIAPVEKTTTPVKKTTASIAETTVSMEKTTAPVKETTVLTTKMSGSTSWWKRTWFTKFSFTGSKSTVSPQPTSTKSSSTVPVTTTGQSTNLNTATTGDWTEVIEVSHQDETTSNLETEGERNPEPSVVPLREEDEEKEMASVQEGKFKKDRRPEGEGSSLGEIDLVDSTTKPLTTEIVPGVLFSTSTSPSTVDNTDTTTQHVEDITAMEARGEIQYKRRNRPRRPEQETETSTTVNLKVTTNSETEDKIQTTLNPKTSTASPSNMTERPGVSTTAGDEDRLSVFDSLLLGNPEIDPGNPEAIRYNGSHDAEVLDRCSCLHGGTCLPYGEGFQCFCPQGYTGESCEIGMWPEAIPTGCTCATLYRK